MSANSSQESDLDALGSKRRPRNYLQNHLGLVDNGVHVVCPPLQHLLSLWGVFGQNVDGANALLLMTQGLFDHIAVETLFRQQRRAVRHRS
jgi:hypothetical protein